MGVGRELYRAGMLDGCWFEAVQRTCPALGQGCPAASRGTVLVLGQSERR